MAKWSTADIPSQAGRTAVVTGANSGLGFVTARELARAGARVVLACRDQQRGADARDRIAAAVPGADIDLRALDLASLASVAEFAEGVRSSYDGLDLLVNNAGVMAIPRRETADGFEMQFGTNHLGHFALTGRLLPLLVGRAGSRVVTVSSTAHKGGRINFDDLMAQRRYRKWRVYSQSKLANLLFAFELQRRLEAAKAPTISVAAHPGYAATNLQAVGPQMTRNKFTEFFIVTIGNSVFAQSDEKGALPQLYAATAPEVVGGAYYGPDGFMENRGAPKRVDSTKQSKNLDDARRLWEVSEQLTGVTYDAMFA
jgi:NAD(P)-dependent dehydrogenase (short-subunit alcohol dehydrogenase family)